MNVAEFVNKWWPGVSKHRIFVWRGPEILCNQGTLVFAGSEHYFFAVLHSHIHEVWARAKGTQLRERESGFRYTPTTSFESFPFPVLSRVFAAYDWDSSLSDGDILARLLALNHERAAGL
jgi:hypothetical protein